MDSAHTSQRQSLELLDQCTAAGSLEAVEISQGNTPDWTVHFTPARLAVFIVALLFVQYPEVLLGTHSFFDRDSGLFTYPLAQYAKQSLWQGEIPLWNPLSHCGIPFLAQWNTTVFYPLSWFYLLLPMPWSLNYFCLGHLVLAGISMYYLARRWTGNPFAASVAGLAYALNGLSFNALMWTSILAALAWMPLVILFLERAWREGGRQIFPAILVGGMQMLSGAPEIILMTWLLAASWWAVDAWRNKSSAKWTILRVAGIAFLVCCLTAVQLVPFLELLGHSDRHSGQSNTAWSMPVWGWANFVVPLFRCSKTILGSYIQTGQQWTSSYYVGLGVLALAGIAMAKVRHARVWWLASAGFLGMILSLGEHGFLYEAIARVFPPIALARYPVKFVALTIFAFPLLAAFAVAWIFQAADRLEASQPRNALGWSAALWSGVALSIAVFAFLRPLPDESAAVTLTSGLERILFLLLVSGGLLLQSRVTSAGKRTGLAVALLLVLGIDALTHVPRQNATIPNRGYGPLELGLNSTPRIGQSRAMVTPQMEAFLSHAATPNPLDCYIGARHSLYMDCNLIDKIPCVGGFYPMNLREEAEVRSLFSASTNFPSGLADFLGIAQISSSDKLWEWSARESYLPWVTAGQTPVFAEATAALTGLAGAGFDPRKTVFLPSEARELIQATNLVKAEVVAAQFSPHQTDLAVQAAGPAMVVLAQCFYPAWKAYVDGHPTRLWRANHAFQAIEVPAGHHRIQLRYEDKAFHVGLMISVTTLTAFTLAWLMASARSRRLGV